MPNLCANAAALARSSSQTATIRCFPLAEMNLACACAICPHPTSSIPRLFSTLPSHQCAVHIGDSRRHRVRAEFLFDAPAAGTSERARERRVIHERCATVRDLVMAPRRHEETADAVLDHFRYSTDAACDDRPAERQRFKQHHRNAFAERRQYEDVHRRQHVVAIVSMTDEMDTV